MLNEKPGEGAVLACLLGRVDFSSLMPFVCVCVCVCGVALKFFLLSDEEVLRAHPRAREDSSRCPQNGRLRKNYLFEYSLSTSIWTGDSPASRGSGGGHCCPTSRPCFFFDILRRIHSPSNITRRPGEPVRSRPCFFNMLLCIYCSSNMS